MLLSDYAYLFRADAKHATFCNIYNSRASFEGHYLKNNFRSSRMQIMELTNCDLLVIITQCLVTTTNIGLPAI